MWFYIDFHSHIPVYEQIKNKIKEKIAKNEIKENEYIPSIRVLAKEIGVNLNTVARAYRELEQEGIIQSIRGSGYVVIGINKDEMINDIMEEFKKVALSAKNLKIEKEKLFEIIGEIYD
ncbi:GntR family transcriptional regulator [Marinitoga sp. 38H-ov]|uniref:GntR family transcriptional regulator n=1 Tax=Marinitoga sp. 38H-ov TaxID=1755814 RepID=UPI0013EB47CD|nr:GntR family transcriptional regulator [Marinitoga sp. 38H-ov]KAF2955278.1 GntR family transcriptional regulator [Marinitoga sp. 38H-ov]